MQDRRRHVIAIADASFGRVGWNNAMPGIVEQQSCQQVVGFVAYNGAVGPLGKGFLPDRLKQRAIHDWRLLTRQDLILVFDLADIEEVAQQVVQRAAPERDPAARRSRGEQPGFGKFPDSGLCGRSRILVAAFGALSLHPEIPFPAAVVEREVRTRLKPYSGFALLTLFRIESERLKLPAPFGRRIGEP